MSPFKRSKRSSSMKKLWAKKLSHKRQEPKVIHTGADVMIDHDYTDFWDPLGEFESIQSEVLTTEVEQHTDEDVIKGNRVVHINYILTQALDKQYCHTRKCTFGELKISSEKRKGLMSIIVLTCTFCSKTFEIFTQKPTNTCDRNNIQKYPINISLVWGTLSSGSTFSQITDILSLLNIPSLSFKTFSSIESQLGDRWKDVLWTFMEKAGKEELELALQNKQICNDGTPWIKVNCDGGWSKRSYGHSYNSLSGTAVIVGNQTGKVLFIGVRNKYCVVCARATNKKIPIATHKCFKNWSGSAAAMEADIIVEGFNCSVDFHGLKYTQIVADGDSSVYAKIKEKVWYGAEVIKFECLNHIIKNYGKELFKLKKNISVPIQTRRLLSSERIKKIQHVVMHMAKANDDVKNFQIDLENVIYHVYGNHLNCNERYCNIIGYLNNNLNDQLSASGLIYYLKDSLEILQRKSHKMIPYQNNNKAECFMALVAKMNCGKRLNLIQRRSFEIRCYLATLQYNEGCSWQPPAFEAITSTNIGDVFLKISTENKKHVAKKTVNANRKKKQIPSLSCEYGPNILDDPLTSSEYLSEFKRILKSLQLWIHIWGVSN